MTLLAPINDLLREILQDQRRYEIRRETEAAKADPKGHRNSRTMVNTDYRYYQIMQGKRIVRFCWTLHKNVAGYYLSFVEIIEGKVGGRSGWIGWETKSGAIENCKARYLDSKKPKAEQRYTIPTYKQLLKRR